MTCNLVSNADNQSSIIDTFGFILKKNVISKHNHFKESKLLFEDDKMKKKS